MKTLRLLIITGMLLLAPVVLLAAQEGGLSSASIQVDGLACPFCAYGLEKHLKKINGVESIEINMKSGHAIVRLKAGAQVDDGVLIEAVQKAGFTARGITRQ